MSANLTRDLVGAGGSRPEIGAGTNAALPHFDHHGYLRADRIHVAAASARSAFGVCGQSRRVFDRRKDDEARARFLEFRRGSEITVQNGPISEGFQMLAKGEKRGNSLRGLVELVGIEPTTSSLRTMRSPS